ncbi:LuxR C-terminal-related transcriptional regulator [Arthrobacter sp. ATA002]|uniref:helix-turn-helix transcriptional regulator n=1 Tax=Arthrobacter sp. ATA002 TaxID=2991715 RepID=UPI0022A733C2|nr:LuxR family transcriptional regulator [Arthrobacter sp. ATA002]WAP52206.1 LuxR C-terminal-related transcriptional regulator [Arthrobacter sp. ATA002]
MLLEAAKALAPLDPPLARETYLHALDAAMIIGVFGEQGSIADVAEVARAAPPPPEPPRPADQLLDGLVTAFTSGYETALPALRQAIDAFRDRGFDGEAIGQMGSRRWLWLATRTAAGIFDDEGTRVLALRNVRLAREAGALTTLPGALAALSGMLVLYGDLSQAAELAAEGAAITQATGAVPQLYAQLSLAAWCGQTEEALRLYSLTAEHAGVPGAGTEYAMAQYALAVLHNGQGNYPAAVTAGIQACQTGELLNSSIALPEVVEAAVRADQLAIAASALEELCSRADASGTAWALGLAERSQALVSTDAAAAGHYRQSIEWLTASGVNGHLARTHLVYGEWLRRQGHRQEAREQLQIAFDALSTMGARAFADRAARELRATGEHPRRRSGRPATTLTAHELQIARLVASGATSREVGAHLFLSPRTIEAHLRSIFRKLEITSRRQLKNLELP